MIINLIYIEQFDTDGILTALYIVIKYIRTQYMHIWTYMKQSYSYTYTYTYLRLSRKQIPCWCSYAQIVPAF